MIQILSLKMISMLFLVGGPTEVKCETWGIGRKVATPLASAGFQGQAMADPRQSTG